MKYRVCPEIWIITSISILFFSTWNIEEVQGINSDMLYRADGKVVDFIKNPFFISGNLSTALPSYWNNLYDNCGTIFRCDINATDGWVDNQSFQLSTQNSTAGTWSWISSNVIEVKANERYEILAHMKLNSWVSQAHIVLEGFNETSQEWYQIEQCPSGINGPMDWKEFDCKFTITPETSAIVLILNAGYSSDEHNEAVTAFDAIHLYKLI